MGRDRDQEEEGKFGQRRDGDSSHVHSPKCNVHSPECNLHIFNLTSVSKILVLILVQFSIPMHMGY